MELKRKRDAIEKAQEAFWASMAESFPEAKTGDLGAHGVFNFDKACTEAADGWIFWNISVYLKKSPDEGT